MGPSWAHLGTLLGPSGGFPGPPGRLLGFSYGFSGDQRGCMRGGMHSSPALFLSRWPGTSPFLYRRVYAKLCRTHFSRSLPHCLASSLQPLLRFILAPASPSFDRFRPYENLVFPLGFCTLWLSVFFASSSPVLSFMTLSCVRVFVDGLAHLMWFLLQGLPQTVLHTFLTLDAQLHSITLSPLYISSNRRPKATKRGAAVDRRRRLQSAAPCLKHGSRAS